MTPAAYIAAIHASARLPRGKAPTLKHLRVFRALIYWQHACPSHNQLRRVAGVCRNTVGNALRRLRDLGLLTWKAQYVWRRVGCLMESHRTVNRYLPSLQTPLLSLIDLRFDCCPTIVAPDEQWLDMTAALVGRCAAITA